MLKVRLLGPLVIEHVDVSITPSATKPRTVLGLLAVNANTVVPLDALIAELWGASAPPSARAVVQTYILQLRKQAAKALQGRVPDPAWTARQLVRTQPGGYMLAAEEACVDTWNFDRLSTAGHREREAGDLKAASRSFSDALSWWRGDPLLDVQAGHALDSYIKRLEEAHLNVLDRHIEVDLRLGRHYELLGELTALVNRYQTHEGLCAHLMLALYRSGRRSEALEVYRGVRARMVEQLALEPSPALRRLHRSMLVSDRAPGDLTDTWRATVASPRRPGPIPADLAATSWDIHPEVPA